MMMYGVLCDHRSGLWAARDERHRQTTLAKKPTVSGRQEDGSCSSSIVLYCLIKECILGYLSLMSLHRLFRVAFLSMTL
jgi:hypothetical protein